jgi:hypothetical protein
MTPEQITKLISGLKEAIDKFNKVTKEGKDGTKELEEGIKGALRGMDNFSGSVGSAATALDNFSRLSISNTNSFNGLVDVIEYSDSALQKFTSGISSMPFLGDLLHPISQSFQNIGNGVKIAAQAGENFAKAYDGLDKGTRENLTTQFKYAAALGMTFDQAEKNNKAFNDLIKTNSDFANSGIYFSGDDFKRGIENLQAAGISMEELSRASGVSSGGMNNMQMMALQAKAMGMDISEYSRKMSDLIRKNGMSVEDSMKMMAGSQELASETGLKLDEVTQSLDSATSGFQRMGTTMDFSRPILKGFADSVKEVGLGITQAADLSAEFSKSLLGIVNNPALAYVMAMKGGVGGGMGGPGGVLNPSIQMEARMLDQSPGNQADMARQQAMATKEMIASMTGGNIITLKQAAASPELQTQFETQRQMLGSFLGINDRQTQSRVLELLSNLDQATAAGDEELAQKIGDQIEEAKTANDKTLDVQQKISQTLDKSIILMQEQLNLQKADVGKSIEKNVMTAIREITDLSEKLSKTEDSEEIDRLTKLRGEKEKSLNDLIGSAASAAKENDGGKKTTPTDTAPGRSEVANPNTSGAISSETHKATIILQHDMPITAQVSQGALSAAGFKIRVGR